MSRSPGSAPFECRVPAVPEAPLVVSIPHTGTQVPPEVAAGFHTEHIRTLPMTDWHLHLLYSFVPRLGVPILHATYSRFVVDLNRPGRASARLYPGRFETGLVPERTFQGERVFTEPPTAEEVEERRARYHAPYHRRLQELIDALRLRFGIAYVIDAHSVASGANLIHDALTEDIYLGDRDGETCEPWLVDLVAEQFAALGLRVARNDPYKGGHITDHYGRLKGVKTLQIEMCQRLYMAEDQPAKALEHPRFQRMRRRLYRVFRAVVDALRARHPPLD